MEKLGEITGKTRVLPCENGSKSRFNWGVILRNGNLRFKSFSTVYDNPILLYIVMSYTVGHSNSLNGVQKNLKMAPIVTECYLNIAFFFKYGTIARFVFVRLSASDLSMVKQCPMKW